jgi:hypothetical protein
VLCQKAVPCSLCFVLICRCEEKDEAISLFTIIICPHPQHLSPS